MGFFARSIQKDPATAFKRAKALRSQIQDLMSEFPGLEQLRACDEELNDLITTGVDAFKSDASQKNLPARTEVRKTAPQAASTPSLDELRTMASEGDLSAGEIQQMVSDGEITAQDAAAIHAVEPAMGVSDLLDEALRDIEAA